MVQMIVLPLELIDSILLKAYLIPLVSPCQLNNRPSETTLFRTMASVHSFWFKMIARRRFRRSIDRRLSAYYRAISRRVTIVRNNQRFLVENLDPTPTIIALLRSVDYLTDMDTIRISALPSKVNKNLEILKGLRTFDPKIFFAFFDCLHECHQDMVASIMEQGGVTVKAKVVFRKDQGLDSLVDQIKILRERNATRNQRTEELIASLKCDQVEILTANRSRNLIALWFWCKSQTALNRLAQIYESGALLELLRKLFKELAARNKEAINTCCSLAIDRNQFNRETGSVDYKINPVLIDTVKTNATTNRGVAVVGLTVLGKELFVASEWSEEVDVFDSITHRFRRKLEFQDMKNPQDLRSCWRNSCLYLMDWRDEGRSNAIMKVSPIGRNIKSWSTGDSFGRLFVTNESHLLMTATRKSSLNEYTSDGQLIRKIEWTEVTRPHPLHTIKLTNGQFLVTHGFGDDIFHGVCLTTTTGVIMTSFGKERGSGIDRLNLPIYMTVDGNGLILVVDHCNSRLLVLSSSLKYERELLSKKHKLRRPWRTHLDEPTGQLFLADNNAMWKDGRVMIFDVK